MAVDGIYRIILDSPIGRQKATLKLVTRGSSLSGTMTGAMGSLDFTEGTVDGANLTWTMEGVVTAMYSRTATWKCTATIDADSITGEAKIGNLGTAPFNGSRAGHGRDHVEKPTIAWTDLGLPRYEAVSIEWVNALNAYVKKKTQGKTVDFEMVWSVEYMNPPRHLLRGRDRDTIGYHFRAKDGKIEAGDGPLEDADIRAVYPYDPFALNLRKNTDEYVAWVAEHGAKYKDQVKTTGDLDKVKLISDLMAGLNNDIREEFLSQQTA